MLTYEEYKQIKLTESFLSKLFGSIVEKFKSLLASLSFGKQVSMKIDIPDSNLNEDIDLKSRLGYLSEFACASTLSSVIKNKGLRLTSRSNPKKLNDEFLAKKKIVQKLGASQSEIDRMVTAGSIIAKQIFEDVIVKDEDLLLLTFDINLTGDSGKGVTKADLILTVTKDSEKVVVDKIVASLKAYKSASINLSNSTFISLIKTLFYDADADISGSTEKFILKFAKDYGSEKDLRQLYDYQNIIGTEMKKGKSKEDARKKAKKTHGDVIEIIAKIFQKYYPKHKKVMNERVLRMLGFDGEDDFYAAIGEAGKQKIISSRKSEELQRMISQLSKNFTLTVKRNGKTNNANILFIAPNGEVITKANITFADTGGPSAQGKTNAFVDFKKFILKRD
jgi:hypothetical protein